MICTICDQAITNPICQSCIGESISAWANEAGVRVEVVPVVECADGEICIKCGGSMSICPHCVCEDTYYEIAEHDTRMAREFAARFDFELRKEIAESMYQVCGQAVPIM